MTFGETRSAARKLALQLDPEIARKRKDAARREAQPLIVFDRYEGMNRPAWGPVPPRGLWGAAMLRNVADGRIAARPAIRSADPFASGKRRMVVMKRRAPFLMACPAGSAKFA